MNRVTLIGRLGAKPELRYTTSGKAVCTMNLATNRKFKNKDGQLQDDVQWHRVIVWGKQAETCSNYLDKGRQIALEGRLQTRAWKDKQNNQRYTTEVVSEHIQFLAASQKSSRKTSVEQEEFGFQQEEEVEELTESALSL